MIPTKITDHVARARARLTDHFRGKPVVQGILDSYSVQCQEIENVLWDVIEKRILNDDTEGDQLDQIGKLVNERRQGRSDADYRPAVRLRIRVNRSKGKAEDILQVARLAFISAPFKYREEYPAGFIVSSWNISQSLAKALVKLLGQTRGAGIRGLLHYSVVPTGQDFIFGSTVGSVTDGSGFSDTVASLPDSRWTSIQEVRP